MSASYIDGAGRVFSGNYWGSVQELQQDYTGSFKSIKKPIFKGSSSSTPGKAASVGEESPSANAESTTPMDDSASFMEEFLPTPTMMQVEAPTSAAATATTAATAATRTTTANFSPPRSSLSSKRAGTSEYPPPPLPSTIDRFQSSQVLFEAIPEKAIHHASDTTRRGEEDDLVPMNSFERSFQSLQSKRSADGVSTGGSSRVRDGASIGGSSRVSRRDRRAARPRLENSPGETVGKNVMGSIAAGQSSIELLTKKIERRRVNRIEVTGPLRATFVKECRKLAAKRGRHNKHKIHMDDLLQYRKEVLAKAVQYDSERLYLRFLYHEILGYVREHDTKLRVVDKAIREMMEVEGDWFYYADFVSYNTTVLPRNGLFTRSATWGAIQMLFLFYLGSAVFFCRVLQDGDICPDDPTEQNRSYYGWLTTVYFASVTMSTVGYGDINFADSSAGNPWRMYIGSVFILVSILMGYTVLAAAANANLERMGNRSKISSYIVERFSAEGDRVPLHKQIRIVAGFRMAELIMFFIFHISTGVFAARFAIRYSNSPEHQWSWMTTYYWAIQTVTTVGYGDVKMPFELRWFQIFYTTLGTALVGSVFAGVANLKGELNDLRRYYAWKRRHVCKRLIEDMKGGDSDDDKIDQYEFMVGSLLTLNKIRISDVEQIMDQFRKLAGPNGYIEFREDAESNVDHNTSNDEGETEDDFVWDLDAADGVD